MRRWKAALVAVLLLTACSERERVELPPPDPDDLVPVEEVYPYDASTIASGCEWWPDRPNCEPVGDVMVFPGPCRDERFGPDCIEVRFFDDVGESPMWDMSMP